MRHEGAERILELCASGFMKAEYEQVRKQIDGDTSLIVSSHVVSILPACMSASFHPWNLGHIPSTGRQ